MRQETFFVKGLLDIYNDISNTTKAIKRSTIRNQIISSVAIAVLSCSVLKLNTQVNRLNAELSKLKTQTCTDENNV